MLRKVLEIGPVGREGVGLVLKAADCDARHLAVCLRINPAP
jgi:hypothetical protein